MSKTYQASQYRLALIRVAAVTLVCVVGCDPGMPKTYPVKGKVVFAGGKSVTDGRIQFQSESDPEIRAMSDIDEGGNFSLTSYVGAKRGNGAPVGTYHVVVELERPTKVIALSRKYTVEPHENEFTITIEDHRR